MATEADPSDEALLPEAAGYQALGDLMGAYPDMAIFRRFRNAGALDLLYRQAELQHAIGRWAAYADLDQTPTSPPDHRRAMDRVFDVLQQSTSKNSTDPRSGMQWQTWQEVSRKLDDYYEKVFRFQRICNLAPADKHHLIQLRKHLSDEDKGAHFLAGKEEWIYQDLNQADLASIASKDEPDLFTKFARGPLIDLIHGWVGRNSRQTITVPKLASNSARNLWFKEYPPGNDVLLSRILYALVASMLVTMAVVSLNYIQSMINRIALIAIYTLVFTALMAVFAHSRPGEVFAVAAAYAAVLVVYASGPTGLSAGSTQ